MLKLQCFSGLPLKVVETRTSSGGFKNERIVDRSSWCRSGDGVKVSCRIPLPSHERRSGRRRRRRIRIDDLCRRREEETDNGGSMPFK